MKEADIPEQISSWNDTSDFQHQLYDCGSFDSWSWVAMNPAWPTFTKLPTNYFQFHILIILDISRSMLATDWTRPYHCSKGYNSDSSQRGPMKKVWLILFAGKPFLSIPFTDDYAWIASVLLNISPYTIRQELPWLSGTAIGDALLLWIWAFSWHITDNKSIILFTDGRVNMYWFMKDNSRYHKRGYTRLYYWYCTSDE